MIKKNRLPTNWRLVRLGDFVKTEKGKKPKFVSKVRSEEFPLPYVNIKAFEKNIIDEYTNGIGCALCEDKDLLIVWDGSRSGYVGKAIQGAVGSTLVNLKFPAICRDYAFYFLKSKFIEINTRTKGVGIPHVDPNLIWNYEFPIPPIIEQKCIVAKIEELFSELDAGIENLQTTSQQLKTYRQAVLKWVFGTIVDPESSLVETCCTNIVDCLHSTAKFTSSGYYCVDTTCIVDSKILFDKIRHVSKDTFDQRISRLKPEAGDILFAREGTVGTTLIVPSHIELCLGQRMMMFRLKKSVNPKFFSYYFQSPLFKSQYKPLIGGTTSPHLNIRDIKKFKVLICSLEEQQRIVGEIESRLNVCDKLEEVIGESLKQAETLRQSILKQAFEGKLIVQDRKFIALSDRQIRFHQLQVLGFILVGCRLRNIQHGEMTSAKYLYLLDKIFGIKTYYRFKRGNLGPFPGDFKKTVNNTQYFTRNYGQIQVINEKRLFNSPNPQKHEIENGISELVRLFQKYSDQERPKKTELLATVCKVIEDIQTTEFEDIRQSMEEWKINLKDKTFNNKAEKFDEEETARCIAFIIKKGWDQKLIK